MIETSINQLTSAIVRLCDLIESKQLMLPLFGEQKVAPNAANPQESEKKPTRGKKNAAQPPTDTGIPASEPAPESGTEPVIVIPTSESDPDPEPGGQLHYGAEPTACCDEVIVESTPEPEPTPTAPAAPTAPVITHETCTNLVKEYRRHNAHLLAAKKINHTEMLRIVNQRFGIEAVSKCPDDKLPALYDALKAICQPIEA